MKTYSIPILLMIIFLTTGCMTISTNGDYNLENGRTLHGNLIMTSGEATIEEGSRVTGDVIMTSGSLNVDGQVDGDIRYTSAKNINLGPDSIVGGDIAGSSGTVTRAEGSIVKGEISENHPITLGVGFFAKAFGVLCGIPLVLFVSTAYLFSRRHNRIQPSPQTPGSSNDDPATRIKKLHKMLDEGLISLADFETKKTEILAEF